MGKTWLGELQRRPQREGGPRCWLLYRRKNVTAPKLINAIANFQTEDSRFAIVTADAGCPNLEPTVADGPHFNLHDKFRRNISPWHEVAHARLAFVGLARPLGIQQRESQP